MLANNGSHFIHSNWATLTPASGWTFVTGDFTGDAKMDALAYQASSGVLSIGRNTGTTFAFTEAATLAPAGGWQLLAGSFAGDGKRDVFGYQPSTGTVWVGTRTGTALNFTQWETLSPAGGWKFQAADFNSDGKTDVLGYFPGNGTLWVGINTGAAFAFQKWAIVAPAADWTFVTANFAGDSRLDLAGYEPVSGTVWVGTNTGTAFSFGQWSTVTPAAGWTFQPGEFSGDTRVDLSGYHPSNGTLWVGSNTGSAFSFAQWGTVTPGPGWQFRPGRFSNTSSSSLARNLVLAGYQPSNGEVVVAANSGGKAELTGYAWPLSAAPGEQVQFFVSGKGSGRAALFRHTATSRGLTSTPMGTATFTPRVRTDAPFAWRDGAGWPVSFSWTVPLSAPSGIYSARLTDPDGDESHITFVVKPPPDHPSGLAVLANINTWLAYNDWGGHSKYSGSANVSFLRPNPAASPVAGGLHLAAGELWILGWLEDAGFHPDAYTDLDFHAGLPAGYHTLIAGTHPEYWSRQMRGQLDGFLAGGGSLLYLGGNGLFENGEYYPDRTGISFRLGVEGGPRSPAIFRALVPAQHERSVLGVATEACVIEGAPYRVKAAGHLLLSGTGLANGQTFGNAGWNTGHGNGKAAAWEVDTRAGPGAIGIPSACTMEPVSVPKSTLPAGLVTLATGMNWKEGGVWKGAD
ncbi:MAG: VCBS repeat-containing protein, partial [Gammaproteobacteria bacterium]|nr:VCBS repeat-containing protein [Gammaproteobacteria bacterium]